MKPFVLICSIGAVSGRIMSSEAPSQTHGGRILFNVDLADPDFPIDLEFSSVTPYNFEDTDSTTIIAQMNVPQNTEVSCTVYECSLRNGETLLFSMKFGSIQTSLHDGTTGLAGACPFDLQANSGSSTKLYLMQTFVGSMSGPVQLFAYCFALPTPPSTATAPACDCFSDHSTVEVADKGTVLMRDLQVNDHVLVGGGDGKPTYESVYAFGHYNKATPTKYLRIHTTESSYPSNPLEISSAHLLRIYGKNHPVRADSIQPGDMLLQTTIGAPATPVVVTKIDTIVRNGAYMPLTKSGYIAVNGVLASNYVASMSYAPRAVSMYLSLARYAAFLSEHQLLHWGLAPYRIVCLGISPNLCKNDYNEEGIAYWLVFLRYCAKLVDAGGLPSQIFALVCIGVLAVFFMAMETLIFFCGGLTGCCIGLLFVMITKQVCGVKRQVPKMKVD